MRRNRPARYVLRGLLGFVFCFAPADVTWSQATDPDDARAVVRRTARKVPLDRDTALDHPLWPALELAVDTYQHIRRNVEDYTCTVVRRERVAGDLRQREFMFAKVRHRRARDGEVVVPFSTYLRFLAPTKVKDREVLYVAGRNDGDMFVRNGGRRFAFVTTRIHPTSDVAMHGNRYPVTEFGFENLVRRLIDVAKEEIAMSANTQVRFYHDAKVDGRPCTGVNVFHPEYDSRLRFHSATVLLDKELRVPIHYEAHDWPGDGEGAERLLEQYTYRDIKLNVGLTDADFDDRNPDYRLR